MKFFLGILALLVVSACAVKLKPKPLEFKENKRYGYYYTGRVLTGIPSSSSFYSGTQFSALVVISHIVNENGVHLNAMYLPLFSFHQVSGEFTDPMGDNVEFPKSEDLNDVNKEILGLTVQYHVNNQTGRFEWIEVDKRDEPWSLNIKKAIIEMFLVDIAGKQLKMDSVHEYSNSKGLHEDINHFFDVYEPTSKGECETMYQVINDLPESVHGLSGVEKFYWKVMKTRNYKNCNNASVLTHHNYASNGCFSYCKQVRISGENRMNNYDSYDKSQCSCDSVDVEPLDQQLTSTYYIESMEYPHIIKAESNGKIVFDNHGTRFISYIKQSLRFAGIFIGKQVEYIKKDKAIRVPNLTFTLNPYTGSSAKVYIHEIPIYNLLVPLDRHTKHEREAIRRIGELLDRVAETILRKKSWQENENQLNVTRYMIKVIQDLSHINNRNILQVFSENCIIENNEDYTNTLNSVKRQLFLDAISHVGTQSVFNWLKDTISKSGRFGLYPTEIRQIIETLPLNVHTPTKNLIQTVETKLYYFMALRHWDSFSAYALSYGKLIAKACPNPKSSSAKKYEESKEKCSIKDTIEYIDNLARSLKRIYSNRGKVLIAQALAHTGKTLALEALTPYAKGEFKCQSDDVSDCTYLRTSIVYSLHQMISVEPKRVRSLVLSIFNNKNEPYDLRLAAFTVFWSTRPRRHELDSVAVSLRNETSLQVISMVRSILEEAANLTNPFDQPLAKAAREVIDTLPKLNLDGVYSKVSYNDWYSTDKSTGFFAQGQFVANNISYIPRHGYLALGSLWKSLSNPWLSFEFQQKGLETALKHLKRDLKSMARDPQNIDELWRDLEIESRDEEEFMLKLYVRVYEQNSLFTMDKHTLKNFYQQFLRIMRNFVSDASNNKVDFNLVRFYMPSTYTDIVPTAIGLPIMAIKQNPQIISLQITKSDSETRKTSDININFKMTPQIFTSSDSSLAVFNQGLKTNLNYGVHTSKKLNLFIPVNIGIGWNLEDNSYKFKYEIEPEFNKVNFHSSNTNFAFTAKSYIGLGLGQIKSINEKKLIESLVPAYKYPFIQLESQEIGMNLHINISTERPWLIDFTRIPCDGSIAWLLEKYNEINQFNHKINLTIIQNKYFPSTGIGGLFRYEQDVGGKFMEIGQLNSTSSGRLTKAKKIGQELTQRYQTKVRDPAFFSRSMDITIATVGHLYPTTFNSRFTLVRAIDYQAYWYRFTSALNNVNHGFLPLIPRVLIIDGKLERSVIPSDLEWRLNNPKGLVASYITDIAWGYYEHREVEYKISVNGLIRRSVRDPVIPEMERQSWYHEQCEKDIRNNIATNYACERLADQQSYFNVITGKIELQKVEEYDRESIRKVYSELKRSLINYRKPWSNISIENVENSKDVVTFEAAYSNLIYKRPLINLQVQTPTEKVEFTKLFVPISPFPTLLPMGYLKASSLPKDQTCTVMKDSVRTFDNVTYRTWTDECEYVVAMDCSKDNKQFAVTVKGKAGKRSVRVYTPRQTYLKIRDVKKDQASLTIHGANDEQIGEDYIVKTGVPVLHISDNGIKNAHQVFMHDGVVNVILPSENVRVAFDGYYLKVTTSPLYIGKTCGLCGNQNQERTYEFVDPELKDLESNLTAFRDSYSLHDCTDPNPCHDDVCDEETPVHYGRRNNYIAAPKKNTRTTESGEHKTIVERRGNVNCFSKYPKLMCKEGQKALKTEAKIIDWVCFEQQHPIHMKWLEMAERGTIIPELAQMETTNREAYESPVECVSVRGI